MIYNAPDPGFEYDDDSRRVGREELWTFLSTVAPWGRWRTRQVVESQLDDSWRVVGAYEKSTGTMVGFARAVSDGHSLAYLADVYVLEKYRGLGLGLGLVDVMIDRGPGAHFRWMLHTNDAHGLYARAGFIPPGPTFMERPGGAPRSA